MHAALLALLAALPPTIAAISALIVALRNDKKITEIHIALNGRLSELLDVNKIAAHAEGRQQEREAIAAQISPPPTITP